VNPFWSRSTFAPLRRQVASVAAERQPFGPHVRWTASHS
jgi:hypothetical protein